MGPVKFSFGHHLKMISLIVPFTSSEMFPYSEAHPDMIQGEGGATLEAYANDLAYLKKKVCLL